MGLFGGQRIDGYTISLLVTLVTYTVLAGGVTSSFQGTTFQNPYGGASLNLGLVQNFTYYDVQNMTKPALGLFQVDFDGLSPIRVGYWDNRIFSDDDFNFMCYGIGFWESLIQYQLEPSGLTEEQVIQDYDFTKNYSRYVLNTGGQLESYVFICPQFFANATHIIYLYDNIEDSIADNEVTVFIGANATFPDFSAYDLVSVIVGFTASTGTPSAVSVLISAIWWVMFLLLLVKLVIG